MQRPTKVFVPGGPGEPLVERDVRREDHEVGPWHPILRHLLEPVASPIGTLQTLSVGRPFRPLGLAPHPALPHHRITG